MPVARLGAESETYFFAGWYFQWRDFPSASHLIEVASRSFRVAKSADLAM
jgi:hypothetical protein